MPKANDLHLQNRGIDGLLRATKLSMIRLMFLIRSLEPGGAERQLVELAIRLDPSRFDITVATFYDGGVFCTKLASVPNIKTVSLHKQGRWDSLGFFARLMKLAKSVQPDIIHGYLPVANELSLVAGRYAGARVVWGVRSSQVELTRTDWVARISYWINRRLSSFPDLIIYNSWAGRDYYQRHGASSKKWAVIPNGIDTGHFDFDSHAGALLKQRWNISPSSTLIGVVGRIEPLKGQNTLLHAAALVHGHQPEVRFVLVGEGTPKYQQELLEITAELGLGDSVVWAGKQADMPAIYSAFDILVSASKSEGFPNVIAEAMSCRRPCVVTDVGDSAHIVNGTGFVVPRGDPEALANVLLRMLQLPAEVRALLGERARERICSCFSVESMVEQTGRILDELVR